jgi:hypothetical protein
MPGLLVQVVGLLDVTERLAIAVVHFQERDDNAMGVGQAHPVTEQGERLLDVSADVVMAAQPAVCPD